MNKFAFINLTHKPPVFKEKREGDIILYGDNVNSPYTDYLSDLFHRSPKHSAIINAKLRYMMGGGWSVDTKGDDIQKKAKAQHIINTANEKETLTEVTEKAEFDRLVYGGFAIEVIRTKAGDNIAEIYHVDFSKIRAFVYDKDEYGNPLYKYCYLPKWDSKSMKYETASKQEGFREWFAFWDKPEEKNTLYYYVPYRPVKNGELNVYPIPEYAAAIGYIDADSEIQNFHANNIKNNFWGGQIVSMNNVFGTAEEQNDFVKRFKQQKTGTDNTGEVLFVFGNSNEQTVTVTPLTPSDLDKQFAQLNEQVRTEIFSVHNITTPLLFGIRTDTGFGGNKDEMQTGYELFYATYIQPKQAIWEGIINYIYSFNGFGKVFSLKAVKPITYQLSENLISQLVPRAELQKLAQEQLGIDLSGDIVQFSEQKKNDLEKQLFEYIDSIGVDYDENDILHSEPVELDKDGMPVKDNWGFAKTYFASLLGVDLDKVEIDVLNAIKDNPEISIQQLSEAFKMPESDMAEIVAKLIENDIIVGEIGDLKVKKSAINDLDEQDIVTRVEVRYRYTDKGAPALKTSSREFCKQLMSKNKLFSISEIEGMLNFQDENTSVWLYRGGWYKNPETKKNTPFCRHHWEAVTVKIK